MKQFFIKKKYENITETLIVPGIQEQLEEIRNICSCMEVIIR